MRNWLCIVVGCGWGAWLCVNSTKSRRISIMRTTSRLRTMRLWKFVWIDDEVMAAFRADRITEFFFSGDARSNCYVIRRVCYWDSWETSSSSLEVSMLSLLVDFRSFRLSENRWNDTLGCTCVRPLWERRKKTCAKYCIVDLISKAIYK